MSTRDWTHKDEWRLRHSTFMVTVEHFTLPVSDDRYRDGGHRWCVYAFIYPEHPLFSRFALRRLDGTKMVIYRSEDCLSGAPLHGGCSLVRPHHDADGKVTSVQFGADYNHLHDRHFTHETEFDGEVKRDAEDLFDFLAAMADGAAHAD